MLTEIDAVEIYKLKIAMLKPSTFKSCLQDAESRIKGQSVRVAALFGVSPKTIRDIWNRRTWAYATIHLWYLEQPDLGEVLENGPSSYKVIVH